MVHANSVCMLIMCCTAMVINTDSHLFLCCSACEWFFAAAKATIQFTSSHHLGGILSHIMWVGLLIMFVTVACIQIVSHHVHFHHTFIDLTSCLLSVCMWFPLKHTRILLIYYFHTLVRMYVMCVYSQHFTNVLLTESMWLFVAIQKQIPKCAMGFLDCQEVGNFLHLKANPLI